MFDFLTKKITLNKEIEEKKQEKKKKTSKKNIKKEKTGLDELNNDTTSKENYYVVDNFYMLYHKKLDKTYKINVKTVDNIFKDYSKHGNNLTGEDILIKYEIKPEVFSLLKSKLRLYKASHVISPYSLGLMDKEQQEVKIEEAVGDSIDNFKGKFVDTYEKQFKTEAKKAFKKVGNAEYYMLALQETIKDYKSPIQEDIKKIGNNIPKININSNKKELEVVLTDLHIGKKGTQEIISDINKITTDIILREEQIINILILGDLGENFSQEIMHAGQHINVEIQNPFQLQLYIVEIFEKMILELRKAGKIVNFYGLSGNHDRYTKNNDGDMMRVAGLVIYEMLKRTFNNVKGVKIEYFQETINPIIINNKKYILSHGEFGFNNKKPEDLLWKYGSQDIFNVILSGHTHQHKQEIGSNFAKIVVAPLAGPGDYDERMGMKGEVGYTIIKNNHTGNGIELVNVILTK